MNRDDPLVETAIFGREVQAFLATPVGKLIIERANSEAMDAQAALNRTFPMRWRRIMELQNRIHRAESIQTWLAEAVMDGVAAERSIQGDDNG